MKPKLLIVGAVLAVVAGMAAFQNSGPAHADPFQARFEAQIAPTTTGSATTTTVDITLPDGSPFFDAAVTSTTGIHQETGVPLGHQVGQNTFDIGVNATGLVGPNSQVLQCGTGTGSTGPVTFPIWSSTPGLPASAPSYPFVTGPGAQPPSSGYIQDYDDDNNNGLPDALEGGAGTDTLAQAIQDNFIGASTAGSDGLPDGVYRTPQYLFLLNAALAAPATEPIARGIGDAVVAAGVVETEVDFLTYSHIPGYRVIISVLGGGGALGLLPASFTSQISETCPNPFTTNVVTFGTSVDAAGVGGTPATVQTIDATAGSAQVFQISLSSADNPDGDAVPNVRDNCRQVANPGQGDTDSDGMGDACDPTPTNDTNGCAGVNPYPFGGDVLTANASGSAAFAPDGIIDDYDCDSFTNLQDNCPTVFNPSQTDLDGDTIGDACEANPVVVNVKGDGLGYADIPPAGTFVDHDTVCIDNWTEGIAEGVDSGTGVECQFLFDTESNWGTSFSPPYPAGADTLRDSDDNGRPDFIPAPPAPTVQEDLEADADGDKCSDGDEVKRAKPGDPLDPWDFYSVPAPALTVNSASVADEGIGISTDVVALLAYSGASAGTTLYDQDLDGNGIPDGLQYDRSKITQYGGDWPAEPDGGIGITTDVLAMLAQSGFTCSALP